ncbi:MAG TPA: GNAT family N-acetyltransferase [Anaerolineae bacterium]|nr:GNAT family N-acetyltransferase [Anaerolineae bacterium]HRJ76544.1 GNAT family protein [Anaerolineales bacterium]
MLAIQTQLFEANDVRFGPIDHETHPEVESKWTHDAEFMRLMELKPIRPLSPAMVKKQYEAIEKEMEEDKNLYYFTIQTKEENKFIGKALIEWIDWTNGNGFLRLGIGASEFRRLGLGSQALSMLLRFAFDELNLYRVTAVVPAYNEGAIKLFQKFGFMEEVRRRKAIHRDNEFWDLVSFGLLNAEWREQVSGDVLSQSKDQG